MRLQDFAQDKVAVIAGLREEHVLALRFYTTMGFKSINNPLRDASRRERNEEHKLKVLVFFLFQAIKQLRAYTANAVDAHTPVFLYRGLKDLRAQDQFLKQGGTVLLARSDACV